MRTHPLENDLNADAADILSAIQKGFRAIIDVKGKLAEYFLDLGCCWFSGHPLTLIRPSFQTPWD
jgi:hypothetical protein